MLRAGERGSADLVAGIAKSLPFRNRTFDLIYCVNALHHFGDPNAFIDHAPVFLRRPGTLSISGIDPRMIRKWYLYEYFAGTYERDLRRFPSVADIVNWMGAAGMDRMEYRVVETTVAMHKGRSVFSDPFLAKNSNSQLALLTDAEYAAGLQRIENVIKQAEKEEREIQFSAELPFMMITGVSR